MTDEHAQSIWYNHENNRLKSEVHYRGVVIAVLFICIIGASFFWLNVSRVHITCAMTFGSQKVATTFLNWGFLNLDRDNDGKACE